MNTQLGELLIAYVVTAGAMLAGLLVMRAGGRAYWRWPVYSVMAMALGVVLWSLLRRHVLPSEWGITRSQTLYFSALALYAMQGLSLGVVLGRATRRQPAPDEAAP
ncbi:MAG TPA: hypothetical protein VFZ61_33400 [Polyangiales bacterium]